MNSIKFLLLWSSPGGGGEKETNMNNNNNKNTNHYVMPRSANFLENLCVGSENHIQVLALLHISWFSVLFCFVSYSNTYKMLQKRKTVLAFRLQENRLQARCGL